MKNVTICKPKRERTALKYGSEERAKQLASHHHNHVIQVTGHNHVTSQQDLSLFWLFKYAHLSPLRAGKRCQRYPAPYGL